MVQICCQQYALGAGDRGRSYEVVAGTREEEVGEYHIIVAESEKATKATITIRVSSIDPEVQTGARSANVWSDLE